MAVVLGLLTAAEAAAQEIRQEIKPVAGHQVSVVGDDTGTAWLVVDGERVLEAGVIFLDGEAVMVGGVPVVTGVAGAGGNACGASPFVLALAEGATPELYGPIESCREFTLDLRPDALLLSTEPLPSEPGEVWVWNPVTGLTEALPEEFSAETGRSWETLPSLAGAHPVEAMQLAPVLQVLQTGLGADYPVFAERISDLGSGDLVPGGYLGRACLKLTCDADWAVLYLDAATEQVFAIWHVYGEVENRIWPAETTQWPEAAMAVLRAEAGE
jgi:hypothetical protein